VKGNSVAFQLGEDIIVGFWEANIPYPAFSVLNLPSAVGRKALRNVCAGRSNLSSKKMI
jgi:hypothetical protein